MPDEQPIFSDDPEAMPYMQQAARPVPYTKGQTSGLAKASFAFGAVGISWVALFYLSWEACRAGFAERMFFVLGTLLGFLGVAVVPVMSFLAFVCGVFGLITIRKYHSRSWLLALLGLLFSLLSVGVYIWWLFYVPSFV